MDHADMIPVYQPCQHDSSVTERMAAARVNQEAALAVFNGIFIIKG